MKMWPLLNTQWVLPLVACLEFGWKTLLGGWLAIALHLRLHFVCVYSVAIAWGVHNALLKQALDAQMRGHL
jgi:hypothetical protein